MRVAGKHRQYGEEGETSELMSESYSRRSWKGIAIAFLVIGAVAAIVALIVVYSKPQPNPNVVEGTLVLEDVVSGKYSAKGLGQAVWISSDTLAYMEHRDLWSFNLTSNESAVLVHHSAWISEPSDFFVSPSRKYVLYSYNQKQEFRHSTFASFAVVEVGSNVTLHNVSNNDQLQLVSWGPGDNLVYVSGNNIFYLGTNWTGSPINVTNDGNENKIFNGIPDWVYEEEVLSAASALWWSPDGNHFAFIKFNDTKVDDMKFIEYGDRNQYYPTVEDIKYPKPGHDNPEVSVWVFDTTAPTLPASQIVEGRDLTNLTYYVTGIKWVDQARFCVVFEPRVQNYSLVSLCRKTDSTTWTCDKDSDYESPGGWVDGSVPVFSSDGQTYFLIQTNDNYKHLRMYKTNNSEPPIFLTEGNYEVTAIQHFDRTNNKVYFLRTGNGTKGAQILHFYSLNVTSMKQTCLSCEQAGCSYASVSLDPSGSHYALTCSDFDNVPTVTLRSLQDNSLVQVWEDNSALKAKLAGQVLSKHEDFEAPTADNFTIKIRIFAPPNFNKNEKKKYPALINVYGGPGSQLITDKFGIDWGTYLATVRRYLYIEVDGRGSAFRGDNLMFQIYKRLGTVEIEDQINAMRFLLRNYSFVDADRVAIWGWSYGGYASAMTLAKGNETFKCAMSVAPVTSWRYYDTIYTERYMLEPNQNLVSYQTSELMNYVNNFKNKKFLLLHGTADDNVHLQQTMMFTKALNNASILFDMHMYPDENHSILQSKVQLYLTLQDFLDKCFS